MKKRNTLQKSIILDALKDFMGKHPTPNEVYEYIHEKHPSISRPSSACLRARSRTERRREFTLLIQHSDMNTE